MSRDSRIFHWLLRHPWLCFLLMACSFTLFGVLTLNMAGYVSANARYLVENGWMAWVDGGFAQLLELWIQIFVATGAFVVFKLCEHALVQRLAHPAGAGK